MATSDKLSDQLRAAVRNADESVYAIGKATNISQSTLSRFLSGERTLSWAAADTLGEYLGLEIRTKERKRGRRGKD